MQRQAWVLFLNWLWLFSLIIVALAILWDKGILQFMFNTDPTYLCLAMVILFLLTCLHVGYRAWYLSQQIHVLIEWGRLKHKQQFSPMQHYLTHLHSADEVQHKQLYAELLAESLRGQHQIGWFITGALIKLGMLGTVIGFVMMLASMTKLESLDITQVQILMQNMTQGMKIALNTTIIGLVSSMLLGLQYLLLDRTADKLVIEAVNFKQPPVSTD